MAGPGRAPEPGLTEPSDWGTAIGATTTGGDASVTVQADLLGAGLGEIYGAAVYEWAAVLDGDGDGGFFGVQVGDFGDGAQRQGLAGGGVAGMAERASIGHFASLEMGRVD